MKKLSLIVVALVGLTTATAHAQSRPATNERVYEDRRAPEDHSAERRAYEAGRADEARRQVEYYRYYRYYNDRYHNEYRPAGYRYVDGYDGSGYDGGYYAPQPQPRQESRDDVGSAAILGFIAGAVIGSQIDQNNQHHHHYGRGHRW